MDGRTYLRWTDVFEFLVSADGKQILYRALRHASAESLQTYLLGQALSFTLLSLGREPLHGACVAINDRAVALLGDCGYGKSTLAAALLARGHRLVTDDLISLDMRRDVCFVHPGLPRLKLFPAVARRLLGAASGRSAAMIHGTSKRILALGPDQSVRQPMPLAALYVLAKPDGSGSPGAHIDGLSGREAFLEVVRGAFNLTVLDSKRYASQFAFASRLVSAVPIRRLAYPRDFSLLSATCDALLGDFDSVKP